jgi:hypothetical protein
MPSLHTFHACLESRGLELTLQDSGLWDTLCLLSYDRLYAASLGQVLLPLSAFTVGERGTTALFAALQNLGQHVTPARRIAPAALLRWLWVSVISAGSLGLLAGAWGWL